MSLRRASSIAFLHRGTGTSRLSLSHSDATLAPSQPLHAAKPSTRPLNDFVTRFNRISSHAAVRAPSPPCIRISIDLAIVFSPAELQSLFRVASANALTRPCYLYPHCRMDRLDAEALCFSASLFQPRISSNAPRLWAAPNELALKRRGRTAPCAERIVLAHNWPLERCTVSRTRSFGICGASAARRTLATFLSLLSLPRKRLLPDARLQAPLAQPSS